jgi:transcriptional regulator with XRE-family HTH domain
MNAPPSAAARGTYVNKLQKRRAEALKTFGNNLRASRKASQLTQEQLADAMELSVAYVSLLERGGRNPPLTTVLHLATVLNVTAQVLLEGA